MHTLLDPAVWWRYGRGKGFEYEFSDEDEIKLLTTGLPEKYKPYEIFALFMEKQDDEYRERYTKIDASQLPIYKKKGIWSYCIGSALLTDLKAIGQEELISRLLATNGLINLQTSRLIKRGLVPAHIGIVDQVRNKVTGEVLIHTEYLAIYRSLLAAARSIKSGQKKYVQSE